MGSRLCLQALMHGLETIHSPAGSGNKGTTEGATSEGVPAIMTKHLEFHDEWLK